MKKGIIEEVEREGEKQMISKVILTKVMSSEGEGEV